MSQRFCHHVNPAGVFCGGPPVNKRDYCFWHLHETGRRMKAARARARSERVIVNLPVLDDLHAVQVGLMQLAEAIAHGEIDYHSGRLMLGVLRLAASNLKSHAGWRAKSDYQTFGVDANIVIEEPGFEQQYDLPKDIQLSVPPEVLFPRPPQPSIETVQPSVQENRPGNRHRRPQPKRKAISLKPLPKTSAAWTGSEAGAPDVPGRKPPQPAAKMPTGQIAGELGSS